MEAKHWMCWYLTQWAFWGFKEELPIPSWLRRPIAFCMGAYIIVSILDFVWTDEIYDEACAYLHAQQK